MAVYVFGAGAWLAVGALAGTFHFLTLRWNVGNFAGGRPVMLVFATQLGRFALIAVVLAVIAVEFGAVALLIATDGILPARMTIVRFGAPS